MRLHGPLPGNLAQRVNDDLLLGVEIDIGIGTTLKVVASGSADAGVGLQLRLRPELRTSDLLGFR